MENSRSYGNITATNLEGVDVAQSVLYVTVHYELSETQYLSAQVKRITESALLSLLGGEGFDGLQVEVVVEMQVVEVLTVDKQVQHVVSLTADLKADLHPV